MGLGDEAIIKLLRDYEFQTVLDVGSGEGKQAAAFRDAGKTVTTVDANPAAKADYREHYPQVWDTFAYGPDSFDGPWDLVWCCHVLEHQPNVGHFLQSLTWACRPSGSILAVTVPPEKPRTVAGHLAHFNAGLLLYNMVYAGIDCSQAAVKTYGYNVTVIVPDARSVANTGAARFIPGIGPHLTLDRSAHLFPVPVEPEGFDGEIAEVNW